MRKVIEKEVAFCDDCGNEADYVHTCIGCGKEYCYDCHDAHLTEFRCGVSFGGSGDGEFCKECIENPPTPKLRKLLKAYLKIRALKTERDAVYNDFQARCKKAEAEVDKTYKEVMAGGR